MRRLALLISAGVMLLLTLAASAGATPPPAGPSVSAQTIDLGQPPPPLAPAPDLPSATGPVRFLADFATPDLSAWQGVSWLGELPAHWRVVNGRLLQDGTYAQVPSEEPAALLGPDAGAAFQLDAALLPLGG